MSKKARYCEDCKTLPFHDADIKTREIVYNAQHAWRNPATLKEPTISQTIKKIIQEWKRMKEKLKAA